MPKNNLYFLCFFIPLFLLPLPTLSLSALVSPPFLTLPPSIPFSFLSLFFFLYNFVFFVTHVMICMKVSIIMHVNLHSWKCCQFYIWSKMNEFLDNFIGLLFLVSFVSKGLYKIHIFQVFFPVSGLYLHFCNPCFETKINVIQLNGSFSGQDIFSLWPPLLSLE